MVIVVQTYFRSFTAKDRLAISGCWWEAMMELDYIFGHEGNHHNQFPAWAFTPEA